MEVFMRMPQIHIDELPQRCRRRHDRFLQYFSRHPDHFITGAAACLIGPWEAIRRANPRPEDFVAVARREPSQTGRKLWQLRFADRERLPEILRRFPDIRRVGLDGYTPRPRRSPALSGADETEPVGPRRPPMPAESGGGLIEAAIRRSGKPREVWVREALMAKARSEMDGVGAPRIPPPPRNGG
jgi:hypothetical protein